jgi:hypothetical protein
MDLRSTSSVCHFRYRRRLRNPHISTPLLPPGESLWGLLTGLHQTATDNPSTIRHSELPPRLDVLARWDVSPTRFASQKPTIEMHSYALPPGLSQAHRYSASVLYSSNLPVTKSLGLDLPELTQSYIRLFFPSDTLTNRLRKGTSKSPHFAQSRTARRGSFSRCPMRSRSLRDRA